ncbi:MAG TPA: hypothetical protein G4N94_10300 [Caldilineae bacterium]|nr:hypothetical protein [Caldilineae bacterium]
MRTVTTVILRLLGDGEESHPLRGILQTLDEAVPHAFKDERELWQCYDNLRRRSPPPHHRLTARMMREHRAVYRPSALRRSTRSGAWFSSVGSITHPIHKVHYLQPSPLTTLLFMQATSSTPVWQPLAAR